MPLLSTNRMPVRAARSSRRGLPPLGLGGSSGNSDSTISQSSSLTNSLAILLPYPDSAVLKGSLRSCGYCPIPQGSSSATHDHLVLCAEQRGAAGHPTRSEPCHESFLPVECFPPLPHQLAPGLLCASWLAAGFRHAEGANRQVPRLHRSRRSAVGLRSPS